MIQFTLETGEMGLCFTFGGRQPPPQVIDIVEHAEAPVVEMISNQGRCCSQPQLEGETDIYKETDQWRVGWIKGELSVGM